MYYKDLTPCEHCDAPLEKSHCTFLNVGWLSCEHDFPIGDVDTDVTEALWWALHHRVNQMRGYHVCDLCSNLEHKHMRVSRGEDTVLIGSAEIWIPGLNNVVYACPNMIYHYVLEHHYLPPQAFINALLNAWRQKTPIDK